MLQTLTEGSSSAQCTINSLFVLVTVHVPSRSVFLDLVGQKMKEVDAVISGMRYVVSSCYQQFIYDSKGNRFEKVNSTIGITNFCRN